jgi:hypothetical protein
MWYPARSVSGVPSVFLLGAVQDKVADPVVGFVGGAGGGGAGVGAGLGAGVGAGLGAGVDPELEDAAAAVEAAGDTPTPLPQAVKSSPANIRGDSENNVLRVLIAGMPRLKYGHWPRAICRSLGT